LARDRRARRFFWPRTGDFKDRTPVYNAPHLRSGEECRDPNHYSARTVYGRLHAGEKKSRIQVFERGDAAFSFSSSRRKEKRKRKASIIRNHFWTPPPSMIPFRKKGGASGQLSFLHPSPSLTKLKKNKGGWGNKGTRFRKLFLLSNLSEEGGDGNYSSIYVGGERGRGGIPLKFICKLPTPFWKEGRKGGRGKGGRA